MSRSQNSDEFRVAFERAVLRDGYLVAHKPYWLRRARVFEAARPRPGDFTGAATENELQERDERLRQMAAACRRQADALDLAELTFDDLGLDFMGRRAA